MAKKDKPDTKGKKTKKTDDDEDEGSTPEFKYGVQDIADELGIKPASVRVQLRNKGIEKAGKSYGWNTKSELKEVIAELRTSTASDDDEDEKPSKKSKKSKKDKAPKSEKKSKGKKAKKAKKSKDEDDDDEDEDDD